MSTVNESHSVTGLAGFSFDWWILWQRKWLVALVTALSLLLGMAYLLVTTPIYEVEARVMVKEEDNPLPNARATRRDVSFLSTQAEVLRSPLIVEEALQSVELATPPEADPVEFVLAALRVSPIEDTHVLKIGFRSTEETQAAELVNALVRSYERYMTQAKQTGYGEMLRFLAENENERREELHALQQQYQEMRSASPLIGQTQNAYQVQLAMVQELGRRLTEAQNRRFDIENQLQAAPRLTLKPVASELQLTAAVVDEAASASSEVTLADGATAVKQHTAEPAAEEMPAPLLTPPSSVVPGSDPVKIQEELRKAETRLQELAQSFGPKHPQHRAAREQIGFWKKALEKSLEMNAQLAAEELYAIRATEQQLSELYDAEYAKVKAMDKWLIEEEQVRNNIRLAEQSLDATLVQIRELQLADYAHTQGAAPVTVRMLESPERNTSQVWPQPVSFLGLCGLLGLIGGGLAAALLPNAKQTDHAPKETRKRQRASKAVVNV